MSATVSAMSVPGGTRMAKDLVRDRAGDTEGAATDAKVRIM